MSRARWLQALMLSALLSASWYESSVGPRAPAQASSHDSSPAADQGPTNLTVARRGYVTPALSPAALQAPKAVHPASSTTSEPIHPLRSQEPLQEQARTIDSARNLIVTRDLSEAQQLLRAVEQQTEQQVEQQTEQQGERQGEALMARADRQALRLATTCLAESSEASRTAARLFLRDVHGSLLRKLVRRLCF